MSTLAEIEAALPELSAEELAQVDATVQRLLRERGGSRGEDVCLDGTPWPKTPAALAQFLQHMDNTPGLPISDGEYARLGAERRQRKAQQIAATKQRMERIERMVE